MTRQQAYFCHFYSNEVLNVQARVIKQEGKTHSNQKEVQLPISRWHDLIQRKFLRWHTHIQKKPVRINKFSKVAAYKINMQKSGAFLHNKQSKKGN